MAPLEPCRLDRRRTAFVEAARSLFVAKGYENTTLGEVVERAGGSLATLYKLFDNKDGLFFAVVFERAASGEEIVRCVSASGGPPADQVRRLAHELHGQMLDPDSISLFRLVISRSISDPDFARQFFEVTVLRTRNAVKGLFADLAERGVRMTESPERLMEIFVEMIAIGLQTEAITHGILTTRSQDDLDARVEFFLRGAGLSDA